MMPLHFIESDPNLEAFYCSGQRSVPRFVKGYEPKTRLPWRFLAMELGGRSRSVPSGDRNGMQMNPFWSQRAKDEHLLRAPRPRDLPQDDVSMEFTLQNS